MNPQRGSDRRGCGGTVQRPRVRGRGRRRL